LSSGTYKGGNPGAIRDTVVFNLSAFLEKDESIAAVNPESFAENFGHDPSCGTGETK